MASLYTRIQHKREFELNWLDSGFIPLQGELIVYLKEVDSSGNILKTKKNGVDTPVVPLPGTGGRTLPYAYDRFKVGDGVTSINDLPFVVDAEFNARIQCGTADPSTATTGQFYFKYSTT